MNYKDATRCETARKYLRAIIIKKGAKTEMQADTRRKSGY